MTDSTYILGEFDETSTDVDITFTHVSGATQVRKMIIADFVGMSSEDKATAMATRATSLMSAFNSRVGLGMFTPPEPVVEEPVVEEAPPAEDPDEEEPFDI